MFQEYISHIASSDLLVGCCALMVCLFAYDLTGLFIPKLVRHVDFKSPIISIGIFGTFLGILGGLYGFNSRNIADSVPLLLEGLKFAFATSVFGMFLSVTLSILHKMVGQTDSENDLLKSIDRNMEGMTSSMTSLARSIESPQELVKQFSEMKDFLRSELKQINSSLEKALEQLGSGATKEVIKALEQVISEFNNNLQEQFGENFKQLNEACLKLVDWQNKYREHVDTAETHLVQVRESLTTSAETASQLVKSNKDVQETCRDVAQLVKTYEVQIQTLEQHLSSCKQLGEEAKTFLTSTEQALQKSSSNMTVFSDAIETSVGKQSAALAKLTEDIDEQLPKALGELEEVLTNITNQFARDYKSLFEFVTSRK